MRSLFPRRGDAFLGHLDGDLVGGAALGVFVPGQGERHVIASNADAARIWGAAIEEWKILTASA